MNVLASSISISVVMIMLMLAGLGLGGGADARGYLHFKPGKSAAVPANKFLAVNGTSAPSNSTHTNCDVKIRMNGGPYQPVSPNGVTINGTKDYSRWSGITPNMTKPGINILEAKFECFPPTGGAVPNFIHHTTHNLTAS
jgi:hypothetical protein